METNSLLTELRRELDESQWPVVVQSLRQEPLTWEAMQDTGPGSLRQRLLAGRDGEATWKLEQWSPASLALTALGLGTTLDTLQEQPLQALPASDIAILEQTEKDLPRSPLSLARAGLHALALRERRRVSGTWDNLGETLLSTPKSVLACLYGMLPSPIEFLRALLETHSSRPRAANNRAVDLALHVLLSNPLPQPKRLEVVQHILETLLEQDRLVALKRLEASSPVLASEAAQRLLEISRGEEPACAPDSLSACRSVESMLARAEICRMAGGAEAALPVLETSLQATKRLEAELNALLAQSAASRGDTEAAVTIWEKAAALDPNSIKMRAGRIHALLDAGRVREAAERLEAEASGENHPLYLLAKARLHACRIKPYYDPENARTTARQALKLAVEAAERDSSYSRQAHATIGDEFFLLLASLLLNLGLPQDAIQAIRQTLLNGPNQPDRLAFLCQAQKAAGDLAGALESAYLATALSPSSESHRRLLVEALEAAGSWEEALVERIRLMEKATSIGAEEYRAFAACAIQAGRPELAIKACEEILKEGSDQNEASEKSEEEKGLTFALLGEAQTTLGENDKALESLEKATQLAPHLASPWLVMARVYDRMGQNKQALETLRYATRAAPDSAEVYLALGEAYLATDSPTQALNALRSAAELASVSTFSASDDPLVPTSGSSLDEHVLSGLRPANYSLSGRISLRLGETLHQLGHLPEARQALEESYRLAPSDPTRAYAYARILLTLGELRLAVTPLETVIQSAPSSAEPYLDYSRCLLQLSGENDLDFGPASQGTPSEVRLRAEGQPHSIVPVERSLTLIRRALELEPDNNEAKAMLAEALAASGDLEAALVEFRKALETELVQEQAWKVRLTYGLGRVALKLGQVETAIAAFQEASQVDSMDARIQCALAEAYEVLGFYEDAYGAARAAILLAPTDLAVLTWFSKKAMELARKAGSCLSQAQSEAVKALESAVQLAPERTDLRVQLGHLQIQIGDRTAARSAYSGVVEANLRNPDEEGSARDLYQAGIGLIDLGDPSGAAVCLERALQTKPEQGILLAEPTIVEMLSALATARNLSGNTEGALEALDQAIKLSPTETMLYLDKVDLLVETGRQDEALTCLENALPANQENRALVQRAALLYRAAGNLPAALAHARLLLESSPQQPGIQEKSALSANRRTALGRSMSLLTETGVRALTADLERTLLLTEEARASLEQPVTKTPDDETATGEELLDYYSIMAELALDAGDLAGATASLSNVLEMNPQHPRLLAIQARITVRQAQIDETERFRLAQMTFNRALDMLNNGDYLASRVQAEAQQPAIRGCSLLIERARALNTRVAIAEAALDLNHWETALQILSEAVKSNPQEPLLHLSLARCLVLRAEYQQLCQNLGVIRHAPGDQALSEAACRSFEEAVELTRQLMPSEMIGDPSYTGALPVRRWEARGAAIFLPGPESALALANFNSQPDDVAAHVLCLGRTGDLGAAGVAARSYPNHPLILTQLALVLAGEKPRQALAAAHAAAEAVHRPGALFRPERSPACPVEIRPLVYALLARLLHFNGGRGGDEILARQSILEALEIWPDEPGWHVLAAEVYLCQDHPDEVYDPASAIAHLEQAIKLDPEQVAPYLVLGQIYLQEGTSNSAKRAIHILEGATKLAPQDYEAWLALSRAYRMANDMEGAAACAEKAIELGPDLIEPILLRGEIALQVNNPRGAQSRAQAALKLDPNDPAALVLLSRSLNALDRPAEALAVLEKALPLAEKPLPLLLEKARLLRRSHGPEAALQALQEVSERYPDEPAALAQLAEALEACDQHDAALQAAQRALRVGFGSGSYSSVEDLAEIHYLLGRLLRRAGQLDQAIHHLNEALQLTPENVDAYLELGHAHDERRQYPQAVKSYQQAIAIDPENHQAYFLAGQALKECKDYVNAEQMLRRAAELSPNDASIHRLLAAVVALNLVHNRRQTSLNV